MIFLKLVHLPLATKPMHSYLHSSTNIFSHHLLQYSPKGQHWAPSRLNLSIISNSFSHTPSSLTTLLTMPSTLPFLQKALFCLPHPGLVCSLGHQSQHVRESVLMEYGVRALRVARVEASRDSPPLFLSPYFCLSLPLPLVWLMTSSAFGQRWMGWTTWTESVSSLAWLYGKLVSGKLKRRKDRIIFIRAY